MRGSGRIAALAAILVLGACSSTTPGSNTGFDGGQPYPVAAAFAPVAAESGAGGSETFADSRWRLMDDILRECDLRFAAPDAALGAYGLETGACSAEMRHVRGWRTAGSAVDLFDAEGEVVGRLVAETAGLYRGTVVLAGGQSVDATLRRL